MEPRQIPSMPLPRPGRAGASDATPQMEWWDMPFLPKDKQQPGKSRPSSARVEPSDPVGYSALSLRHCASSRYVQHPTPLKSLSDLKTESTLPMYLTKRERHRIRKKRRAEEELERRDKEAMGLVPPREPKLKLSNFMRVLGDKAVIDPSKMEMTVLQQIYKRQAEHELKNAKNKLTPAQRSQKAWLKREQKESKTIAATSLHVAVFVVNSLLDVKTIVKLRRDANQWFLSGCLLNCLDTDDESKGDGVQFVMVEGGPRGVRKFTRLMLHRIKWNQMSSSSGSSSSDGDGGDGDGDGDGDGGRDLGDAENADDKGDKTCVVTMDADSGEDEEEDKEEDEEEEAGEAKCKLLWSGLSAKRAFPTLRQHTANTLGGARHWLEGHRLAHFYHKLQQEGFAGLE